MASASSDSWSVCGCGICHRQLLRQGDGPRDAPTVASGVHHDPPQPAFQRPITTKALEALDGSNERLLDEIRCCLP